MRRFVQNCCVALVALAALFWAAASSAIEYEALGGRPANAVPGVENSASWFIYGLEPGEQKQDAVLVLNLYAEPMHAVVYAADSSPSSSGGFALKQLNDQQEQVGTWVRFYPNDPPEKFKEIFAQKEKDIIYLCNANREKLQQDLGGQSLADGEWSDLKKWCEGETLIKRDMQAKEEYLLPFVFSVPENADVGEHTGGILIQKGLVEDAAEMQGSGVRLTTRVGVRIYETVPGQVVRKMSLDDFAIIKNFSEFDISRMLLRAEKPEEYLVQTIVSNQGNASINHQDNLVIRDLLFKKRDEDITRQFQVLRDDSFVANYTWNNPRFGRFSFQAEIKYEDQDGTEKTITSEVIKLWIIPWREIVVSLAIVLLLLAVIVYFRRRWNKKYSGQGWMRYAVKPGDNVGSLAQKFQTDWKMLVRTNKLKKPYHLAPGQTIKVPGQAGKAMKTKVSYKGLVIRLVILALIAVVAVAIVLITKSRHNSGEIKGKIDIQSPRN